MGTRVTATRKLALLFGATWVTCLGAAGILLYHFQGAARSYESELRSQDAARQMQLTFKKEVQEWKDLLIRGS